MAKTKKQLTPEQRAERYQQQREKLQRAAEKMLTTDGWAQWVATRSKFHNYSFHNTQLIALQCPNATFVNSYKRWKADFNRQVVKGEKAIGILAPIIVKEEVEEAGKKVEKRRLKGFRGVPVFDVSQTEQIEDLPEISLNPPREPLTGDSHQKLLAELTGFASEIGTEVSFEELKGHRRGYHDPVSHKIVVDSSQEINAQVRTLIHEIAHALGIGYEEYGQGNAEVIVETATYIVCAGLHLDTSGESVPYIAGWGERNNVETVTKAAKVIDEVAGKIEENISKSFFE